MLAIPEGGPPRNNDASSASDGAPLENLFQGKYRRPTSLMGTGEVGIPQARIS